ncbi:MAG TPA: hypothetical protein VLH81_05920 [Desulfobacterales bacterium]|nr:hypothetical protein [Desulfobacterales bacterium]
MVMIASGVFSSRDASATNRYSFEDCVAHATDTPEQFARVPNVHPRPNMGWDVMPRGLARHLVAIWKE